MIAHVYLWSNGALMVFDQAGEQMPAYQGSARDQLARVLADAPESARFSIGDWRTGAVPTLRAALARLAEQFATEPEAGSEPCRE